MLDTVNVIQFDNIECTSIEKMASFPETEEGNKEAEKLYLKWCSTNYKINEGSDLESAILGDGYFEDDTGMVVIITHSTEPDE